ncbi:MAG: DUF59 domain-containing protein, partial [Steroidobacteraceae bacterium]|nr:DUF59 domain-containing protein [Steroidobacteraceae bacterium]
MNAASAAQDAVQKRLASYLDPYSGRTLEEAKAIVSVSVDGALIRVELRLGFPCADYAAELTPALLDHLAPVLGGAGLELTLRADITAHAVQKTLKPLQGVKNIVAVASGKGGV